MASTPAPEASRSSLGTLDTVGARLNSVDQKRFQEAASKQTDEGNKKAALAAARRMERAQVVNEGLARSGGSNVHEQVKQLGNVEQQVVGTFNDEHGRMKAARGRVEAIARDAAKVGNTEIQDRANEVQDKLRAGMDLASGMEVLRIGGGEKLAEEWTTEESAIRLAGQLGIDIYERSKGVTQIDPATSKPKLRDQAQISRDIELRMQQLAKDHGIDLKKKEPGANGAVVERDKTGVEIAQELNRKVDTAVAIARGGKLGTLIMDQLRDCGFVDNNDPLAHVLIQNILARSEVQDKVYKVIKQAKLDDIKKFDPSKAAEIRKLLGEVGNELNDPTARAAGSHITEEANRIDQGFEKALTELKDDRLAKLYGRWRDISYDENGVLRVDKRGARAQLREDLTTIIRHPDNDLGLRMVIARSMGIDDADANEITSIDALREVCGPEYAAVDQILSQHGNEIKGKMFQRFVGLRGMTDVGLFNTFLTGEGGLYFNRQSLETLGNFFGEVPEEYLKKNPQVQKVLKTIDKSTLANMEKWQKLGLWLLLGLMVAGGGAAVGGIAAAMGGAAVGTGALTGLGVGAGGSAAVGGGIAAANEPREPTIDLWPGR